MCFCMQMAWESIDFGNKEFVTLSKHSCLDLLRHPSLTILVFQNICNFDFVIFIAPHTELIMYPVSKYHFIEYMNNIEGCINYTQRVFGYVIKWANYRANHLSNQPEYNPRSMYN